MTARTLLVYSSLSGNTRALAGAVLEALPPGTPMFPVHKAPDPGGFDFIALGFWVYRAGPDPRMLRYMSRVHGKTVGLFGTLAAWPDSPHAQKVLANAAAALAGNRIVLNYLCQGRLSDRQMEQRLKRQSSRHPMTPERAARLAEAARHPDALDLARAREAFRLALEDLS